jgi:hypothetical protein
VPEGAGETCSGGQGQGAPGIAGQALNGAQGERTLLRERLLGRREEIEAAISNRVFSLADPAEIGDPGYTAGLREAVSVGIDYALHAVFESDGKQTPIPSALFVQAREAARNGVSLDTVLRRYLAGHTLLGDFILQEAEESLSTEGLRRVCRLQATLFDRVLLAVTEEYKRHVDPRRPSVAQARAERVRSLLAGELVDPSELGYEIEGRRHLGAIAAGPAARSALRHLSTRLDCSSLVVDGGTCAWGWFGGERAPEAKALIELASSEWPEDLALALGEAGEGFGGWRLTHRQAEVAIAIPQRRSPGVLRYREVALLCATLNDEVLASSLQEIYLRPIAGECESRDSPCQTLRAYFAAERNVSSTAAALGVSRPTVTSRLQAIAERIGQPLGECSAQLEVALELEEMNQAGLDRLPNPGSLPSYIDKAHLRSP